MKEKIIKVLCENQGLALTAYKNYIPEIIGEFDFIFPMKDVEDSNILLISGVTIEFINSFKELLNEGVLSFKPCDILVVGFDGGEVYNLPIAKPSKKLKTLHWLPIVIVKGEKFPNELD